MINYRDCIIALVEEMNTMITPDVDKRYFEYIYEELVENKKYRQYLIYKETFITKGTLTKEILITTSECGYEEGCEDVNKRIPVIAYYQHLLSLLVSNIDMEIEPGISLKSLIEIGITKKIQNEKI